MCHLVHRSERALDPALREVEEHQSPPDRLPAAHHARRLRGRECREKRAGVRERVPHDHLGAPGCQIESAAAGGGGLRTARAT